LPEIGVRYAHLDGPDEPRPAAAGPGKKDIEKQNDDMFGLVPIFLFRLWELTKGEEIANEYTTRKICARR
jgi:hypothetical protein